MKSRNKSGKSIERESFQGKRKASQNMPRSRTKRSKVVDRSSSEEVVDIAQARSK